ncbi:MAG: hypothetical protein CO028_02975 [Candidatus Levybacteria bacterium CG_4_9_14_0_2_um_filter_35_21]|nr:MAG: hypothetical protein CO028_02975 [Candidatus Levybacteria bacterium CG_4_9_14_0_2_um_filter_35_21]
MDKIQIYKVKNNNKSDIYRSGAWIDGSNMKKLEEMLKMYLRTKYVVLTNSGTSALLASYWVLSRNYSNLIVDPYTFPATYQPARLLKYNVSFKKTIFLDKIEQKDKKQTLYTITHLFGQPNKIISSFKTKNFIEDACQSFGAERFGKKVGTFGALGCFSFYPTKTLHTCGHGGAVVTDNEDYYKMLKVFVESGRLKGNITNEISLNLRMDEIKAEFLLNELRHYDERMDYQREIAKDFSSSISGSQPFLEEDRNDRHIYSTFNLIIDKRHAFKEYMDNLGIETVIYYGKEVLPSSERDKYVNITEKIVAIPCRWSLTKNEIARIKKALKGFFK